MREKFVVVGSLLLGLAGCAEGDPGNEIRGEQAELTEARGEVAETTHALNAVMTGLATLTLDLVPPDMASQPQPELPLADAMRARAEAVFGTNCSSGKPAFAQIGVGFVVDFGTGCNCPSLGGMVSGTLSVGASLGGQASAALVDLQGLTVNGLAVTGTVSVAVAAHASLEIDLSAETSVGSIAVSGTATLGVGLGVGVGAGVGVGVGVAVGVGVGVGTGACTGACPGACTNACPVADAGASAVIAGELTFTGQVGVTVSGQAAILAVAGLHFGAGSCFPDRGTITAQVEGHVVTATCDNTTAVTGQLLIAIDQTNTTVALPPAGSCGA